MRALILECENLIAEADKAHSLTVFQNDTVRYPRLELFQRQV
jgi:hypothetical protein